MKAKIMRVLLILSVVIVIDLYSTEAQAGAPKHRYTAEGYSKNNVSKAKANAVWRGKKHNKLFHKRHHRPIVKGNGRIEKRNTTTTCPLSNKY
jgi:hypothetical protein